MGEETGATEVGVSELGVTKCDTPKPEGPVDYRQPAKTCVSHIMRPIYE